MPCKAPEADVRRCGRAGKFANGTDKKEGPLARAFSKQTEAADYCLTSSFAASAASVVAFDDDAIAERLQQLFSTEAFRVYTNTDVVGCEVAGALKNVMAIAAGIADGMAFGDNTKAALITRGLAELARLGIALGGEPLTFSGLAGMGDLIATCISPQSRNRHVGVELGRGRSLDEIVADMNMVAEGVKTSRAVVDLAARHGVEMPIAEQVVAVLYEGKHAADLVPALMHRRQRAELHGIAGQ